MGVKTEAWSCITRVTDAVPAFDASTIELRESSGGQIPGRDHRRDGDLARAARRALPHAEHAPMVRVVL
jgi:hypothetical protein